MAQRTCSIGGCDHKHLARGYCGTHYNKLIQGEAKRHPRIEIPCVICAATVSRRKDSRYQPTCSVACRAVVQWGQCVAQPSAYVWQYNAIKRAKQHGCRIVDQFDRDEIFDRDGWLCQDCGVRCAQPDPYNVRSATVDHIIPLALGGVHSLANAQTLCLSCNSRKAARLPQVA